MPLKIYNILKMASALQVCSSVRLTGDRFTGFLFFSYVVIRFFNPFIFIRQNTCRFLLIKAHTLPRLVYEGIIFLHLQL